MLLAWLAVGGIGGPFQGRLAEVQTNDSSTFLPADAESTRAAQEQQRFTGAQPLPAVVVYERAGGLTADDLGTIRAHAADAARSPGVESVSPVIPAPDGAAAQFIASYPAQARGELDESIPQLRELLAADLPAGLTVHVTGPAGLAADLSAAFAGIDGLLLAVAAGVVALILLIVYRSPLLPVLVLLSAGLALCLAVIAVYLLADAELITLSGQTQGILFILVVGAATDYALLLIARYREELRRTESTRAAMRSAWRAAVEPVLASAGTVVLGLLCLLLSGLNSNRGLGPVAALGIVASVLAALTFLPAALLLFGRAAFWPFRPRAGTGEAGSGLWARIAEAVGRRPRRLWIVTALALGVLAAFVPQFQASGVAQSDFFVDKSSVDSVQGQEALSRHFPGGTGSPAVIVVAAPAQDQVLAAARAVPGIVSVEPDSDRVVDGRVLLDAVLADPADSEAAVDTVAQLRQAVAAVPGSSALVGGVTATQLDTQAAAERDLRVVVPAVLVVVFLVLAALLRAVVAPLLLIATVVLSFAATLGIGALVFNHVLELPGADPSVPLFAFVFLVALGVDYNIFLMSRVREETRLVGTREGVVRGLRVTGGVITSAGVVLAATFAALAVLPILFLLQIAFLVAVGVLVDTLLVRSVLVPALTLDIGPRVWWPSTLDTGDRRRAQEVAGRSSEHSG
ncbi:membrane protein [Pseudonocardia sulfidoxydans NBRC 16205]|uniref:Membrane protein n=1 Tax=Pseudonocardia sulfidoxydans NBRC 16205 TaxID=1223511 RepID=A0A511DMS1_9PSEU|nr:membrane protein [Pseudonocardia sulfidoxydans NBRC 16205]